MIDSYHGLNINKNNWAMYLEDGTHHNQNGRERFGRFIGQCLTAGADGGTLPTMSPTVKGGAKVGAGLKMTGDVLSVDLTAWTGGDY